jgi:hypothetical protein
MGVARTINQSSYTRFQVKKPIPKTTKTTKLSLRKNLPTLPLDVTPFPMPKGLIGFGFCAPPETYCIYTSIRT